MPDRTLTTKDDPLSKKGYKIVKDKMTLLFCTNWKSQVTTTNDLEVQASRCLYHVNRDTLPVIYTLQEFVDDGKHLPRLVPDELHPSRKKAPEIYRPIRESSAAN
jgi:hypothetical protein